MYVLIQYKYTLRLVIKSWYDIVPYPAILISSFVDFGPSPRLEAKDEREK